ncbi:energy transducer TonB [Bacteroides reticulotermitis]|uniref:Ferric siderophore transport system n=2 Tax=Bacteroides reticulotermitis TaxID=1133319 RepID=W4UV17_9BACE|nr:energy transducer TonB [Bacteroides reticulotermitis]MBB4043714.1 TonB family protein [Bacteroides reticulotermitis]GAE84667.1 ferric siderophore transport system [Bacteroides reticulotermitis JCM 10512]
MRRGKQTCRILKEIRRQIAVANDIDFITSECQYQGDCLGTCPKCEAEVRYLEQQLEHKQVRGKAITVLGISAGVIAAASLTACGSSSNKGNEINAIPNEITTPVTEEPTPLLGDSIPPKDSIKVRTTTIGFIAPVIADEIDTESDEIVSGLLPTEEIIPDEAVIQDIVDLPEVWAQFPGGMSELMNFIAANIIYPQELAQGEISMQGRVIIEMIIDKEGDIVQSKIIRGIHPLLDKEALRVVQLMPKWKPGLVDGQPVLSKFTIPIVFKL